MDISIFVELYSVTAAVSAKPISDRLTCHRLTAALLLCDAFLIGPECLGGLASNFL